MPMAFPDQLSLTFQDPIPAMSESPSFRRGFRPRISPTKATVVGGSKIAAEFVVPIYEADSACGRPTLALSAF